MDYMAEIAAIAKSHGGIIETKTAAQRGISKAMLYKLCKEDKIHRIVKGQYILPDDMQDELLAISNRSEKVIFSHETALYLHAISDRTPFEHTITAPSGCIPHKSGFRRWGRARRLARPESGLFHFYRVPVPAPTSAFHRLKNPPRPHRRS